MSALPSPGRSSGSFPEQRLVIEPLELRESKLVSGDSEAIRKFSDKYNVPEKLVAEYEERGD